MKNEKSKPDHLAFISKLFLYQFLFISLTFLGCEKEFDIAVENVNPDYQVTLVSPSEEIQYNAADSLVAVRIAFNPAGSIKSVFCEIYASDNSKLTSSPLNLYDDGKSTSGDATANDGIFSNKIPLSRYYPNGVYNIKYYVIDNSDQSKQVAIANFNYDNGQNNIAPVISNLILVDSINVGISFIFSVFASDANGYSDIKNVYFELYRPDGTLVTEGNGNSKFKMYDDGNLTVYGDQVASDGIFSFKNSFLNDISTQRGFWRFEFIAMDRGNKLSNKIIKSVKII